MKINVVNINTGKVTSIDSAETLYVESYGNKVLLHTRDQVYRPVITLKDFSLMLSSEGFISLSKSNVTNTNRIDNYDDISKRVFFDKGRKGKSVEVSRRKRHIIED
ncbi:LytTR family DNA-binding domain-containing protein [Paenibacillus sp. DMB5]|uniref:LytTR family DNA-binding domain-containing protein n=1 Tax=Paenibacillus sp. DMB5 TaxID=1780103 RepID=UPI000838B83B|nr:LytTR family DNA-binding domain-containing protein [Paenibacillus sp. DMB5]